MKGLEKTMLETKISELEDIANNVKIKSSERIETIIILSICVGFLAGMGSVLFSLVLTKWILG